MIPLSESTIREQIAAIDGDACSAMRKTRRYLGLSRDIRSAVAAMEGAGDSDAVVRVFRLLDEDVRVRAWRTLRASRRRRLGFGYGPQVSPKVEWSGKSGRR